LVSKFLENGCANGEKVILFAYEESRAQLLRNATSWGIDFEDWSRKGCSKFSVLTPNRLA
jgi:circadian clock protein KaiC